MDPSTLTSAVTMSAAAFRGEVQVSVMKRAAAVDARIADMVAATAQPSTSSTPGAGLGANLDITV